MAGRGHEGVQSDRGMGPIFGVEQHHGRWFAVVRTMGAERRLLAARLARGRDDARLRLQVLKAYLALNPGPTAPILERWLIEGLVEGR
jgi:hypothetical protein